MNIESWKATDNDWVEERQRTWKTEGMPLVVSMYQRGGGDLNPEKAEAIKPYYLTGIIHEGQEFPLFYKLRFYPGDDQAWLEDCFYSADDFSLGRFFSMYRGDCLGKHDKTIAKIIYSPSATARLDSMSDSQGNGRNGEVVAKRDHHLVSEWRLYIGRSMKKYRTPPDYYVFKVGNDWLSVAQDFEGRSNRNNDGFIELIETIISRVVKKLSSDDDKNSKEYQFALEIKSVLDEGLCEAHGLRETWESKKPPETLA